MSVQTEDRVKEWIIWFNEHLNDGGDLKMKTSFLAKAVEGCFELLIMCLMDIQNLEGRGKQNRMLIELPQLFRRHRK